MNSTDTAARAAVGIPAGGFGIIDEPESVAVSWVTSFLLVEADGAMSILSPHQDPISLLDPKFARKEYLIQICEGLKPRDIDHHGLSAACDSLSRTCGDDVTLSPGELPGQVFMCLPASRASSEPLLEPDGLERRSLARWTSALIHGRYWDPHTPFILHLLPRDPETSKRLAVLRALRDLGAKIRSLRQDEGERDAFDIDVWWTRWQERFISSLPQSAQIQPLSLDVLLRAADDVPDTEFMENLERIIRHRR